MDDPSAMTAPGGPPSIDPAPDWFDLLTAAGDPHRRAVLSTLCEAHELSIEELASRIEARDGGATADPASLYHVHLPKLVDVDLVEVSGGGETVRRGPAFDVDTVEALERDAGTGGIGDAALAALEEPRRRRVVSVLAETRGTLDLEELAEALSRRSPRVPRPGEPARDAAVQLHHVDLPKLDAAGIVDYDPEDCLVTYRGLPADLDAAATDV